MMYLIHRSKAQCRANRLKGGLPRGRGLPARKYGQGQGTGSILSDVSEVGQPFTRVFGVKTRHADKAQEPAFKLTGYKEPQLPAKVVIPLNTWKRKQHLEEKAQCLNRTDLVPGLTLNKANLTREDLSFLKYKMGKYSFFSLLTSMSKRKSKLTGN